MAGKSALPAFLVIEAWARQTTAAAETAAAERLEEAQAKAEQVKVEGEQALRQAVLDAEKEALRGVETNARNRVSDARIALNRWIDAAEESVDAVLDEAVAKIVGDA